MNIEDFREYCLSFPGTTEECPFGPEHIVFKVLGKMFALCSIDDFGDVNLKCDPEMAEQLRAEYAQIQPGYHMNKKHWNTVRITELPDKIAAEQIRHSYEQVCAGLTKKQRLELASLLKKA